MSEPARPPVQARAQVRPAETPGVSELLSLAVAVVVIVGLYFGREILVPITLAILLSFLLAPLVGLLRRLRLPRVPAVLMAVVLALAVIVALGTVVGSQIAQLAGNLPSYQSTVETKIDALRTQTLKPLTDRINRVGQQFEHASTTNPPAPSAALTHGEPAKPMQVQVEQRAPSPLVLAERYLSPVLSPLATTGIVFIVAIFILLQQEDLRNRMIRLFGSSDLHRTTLAMDDGARRLSRYFITQLAINSAFGVIVGAGLLIIGVPNPVLWGILSALLRFVPYIGSIISGVLPAALAAAVDPGWGMALWTMALFLVSESVMGQVVEPILYGHSTGMSPISVVVAAIFWSWLWGPIGLILSTPLTLCLVVLGRHVKRFEFLDVMLGDQPPLSPVESFYQRLLAGDADELQDQAERSLKDTSLIAYYDEVVLKGLQLAASDSDRGVLADARLERVHTTIEGLVDELAATQDEVPALAVEPAHPAGSVLCVAGRGALDGSAALILEQVLSRHGLAVTLVPHEATSRGRIGQLPREEVTTVCICHLEIAGSMTHLRYLLRRLRRHWPHAQMVVGLWPSEAGALPVERLKAALGADHYARSLQELMDFCLAVPAAAHSAVSGTSMMQASPVGS